MADSRSGTRPPPSAPLARGLAELAADAPDGLAVLDANGRFIQLNPTAAKLCGRPESDLIGTAAPFTPGSDAGGHKSPGLFEDASTEQVTTWSPAPGFRREFAYRLQRPLSDPALTVVAFRDVTEERRRQRRIAAIARTAAQLASQGSLTVALDALAAEVVKTDGLAGVQILTLDDSGSSLQIMGSAGFPHWPDFFDRLTEVQKRGGRLQMFEALATRKPVVVPDRWTAIEHDHSWEPIRDYLSELQWGSFASLPLMIRGGPVGVLNAYFAPDQVIGRRTLEFLVAMAEQAAIAVDYAALMHRERDAARREERQKLARDLHDSIVQQVFSISMQAMSMEVLGQRGDMVPAETVRRIADEVGALSRTALTDLRAMVHELHPTSSAELSGLEEAIRALIDATRNRTGLRFSLALGRDLEQIKGEMAEDIYRIIAEVIHNITKHANATKVTIRLAVRGDLFTATVHDDGRGIGTANVDPHEDATVPGSGYGLRMMRERAGRWDGTVTVKPRRQGGTTARITIPAAGGLPPSRDGFPVPAEHEWRPVGAPPGRMP